MEVFKLSIILFVLCFVTADAGKIRKNKKSKCSVCNEKRLNLTTPAEIGARFQSLPPRVWARDIPLTSLGRRYKYLVLDLAQNGNPDTSFLATVSSVFFNNLISYLDQKPDACAMAAIINATVSCVADKDGAPIQSALDQMQSRFPDIFYYDMLTMIYEAGCDYRCGKSPPDPKINKTQCFDNGLTYNIEELWNLPGAPYADIDPELRQLVLRMYRSNNFVDRFLAMCTTFALSEVTQRLFKAWNPNLVIELAELQFSGPINPKCCYERIKRAESVRQDNKQENVRTFGNEKATINCS